MPTCLELFCSSGVEGRALQILVDENVPAFGCEAEPCSPYSPGPVANEEDVAFLLIDPLHFDAKLGVVAPAAFQELTNRDLSVLRLSYATKAEATSTREELIARGAPPKMRMVNEACIANVAHLRAEVPNRGRLIGVFDTSLETKRSHASLFTTAAVLQSGLLRKVARQRVHEVMTKRRENLDDLIGELPE